MFSLGRLLLFSPLLLRPISTDPEVDKYTKNTLLLHSLLVGTSFALWNWLTVTNFKKSVLVWVVVVFGQYMHAPMHLFLIYYCCCQYYVLGVVCPKVMTDQEHIYKWTNQTLKEKLLMPNCWCENLQISQIYEPIYSMHILDNKPWIWRKCSNDIATYYECYPCDCCFDLKAINHYP